MMSVPVLLKRPLFLARLGVVCSMALVFWSFLAYVNMRELVELGVSLHHRTSGIVSFEDRHKDRTGLANGQTGFSPVDRNPHHLYTVALAWAKKKGMASSVQNLYLKRANGTAGETKPTPKKKVKKLVKRDVAHATVVSRTRPTAQAKSRVQRKNIPLSRDSWEPRFILPIPRSQWWLSSPFGPRRLGRGRRDFHKGIDMAAVRGTPVRSAGDGVVIFAGFARGYGNLVVVEHDDRFRTRYAHLSAITTRVGREVKEGEMIGRVGATGRVIRRSGDGSHLHFEVEVSGRRMNPFYFLKV